MSERQIQFAFIAQSPFLSVEMGILLLRQTNVSGANRMVITDGGDAQSGKICCWILKFCRRS